MSIKKGTVLLLNKVNALESKLQAFFSKRTVPEVVKYKPSGERKSQSE